MLKYTGHPFVDVGVATITAFAGKRRPEDLTEADLDAIAKYISPDILAIADPPDTGQVPVALMGSIPA